MAFADGVLRLVRIGAGIPAGEASPVEPEEAPTSDFALVDVYDLEPTEPEAASAVVAVADVAAADTVVADFAAAAVAPSNVAPANDALQIGPFSASAEGNSETVALVPASPGLADIQAAISMIDAGLAERIVLAGFPSWPGLLWQSYQLAEAANVQIVPTIARPGGWVDIVIEKVAQ